MTNAAVITMIVTMAIVFGFAGYFFWKVIVTPRKTEEG
jgi:hypothetical protein